MIFFLTNKHFVRTYVIFIKYVHLWKNKLSDENLWEVDPTNQIDVISKSFCLHFDGKLSKVIDVDGRSNSSLLIRFRPKFDAEIEPTSMVEQISSSQSRRPIPSDSRRTHKPKLQHRWLKILPLVQT